MYDSGHNSEGKVYDSGHNSEGKVTTMKRVNEVLSYLLPEVDKFSNSV